LFWFLVLWLRGGENKSTKTHVFTHFTTYSLVCVSCRLVFPVPQSVERPQIVRPSTQLGFELRARRRNNDWGLGEAGRLRADAEIAVNKRFPMWGQVDSKAMAHEKPSAVEALEALKAKKAEQYLPGQGQRKHVYKTVKDLAREEAAAAAAAGAAGAAVAGVTQRRSMRWEYARFSEMKLLLTYQGAPVSFRCAMLPVGPPPYSPFQG
jgi:hypothetical protein